MIHASTEPKCKEVSHIVFRNFLILLKKIQIWTLIFDRYFYKTRIFLKMTYVKSNHVTPKNKWNK